MTSLLRSFAVAVAAAALLAPAAACERRKAPGADMKAADDWGGTAQPGGADPSNPHAGVDMSGGGAMGGGGDPHAGIDMSGAGGGADPHAGLGIDPHAGVDMGGGADPHAGLDMTGPGGLPAPDPNRVIDPNKYLRGTISLGPAANGKAPTTGVVFLAVRPADAQGNPAGPPLAVDVMPVAAFPMAFELSEAKQMIDGTTFVGTVVISARVDQDQDVDTRQPGDLSGAIAATIPSDGLALVLDTVQP